MKAPLISNNGILLKNKYRKYEIFSWVFIFAFLPSCVWSQTAIATRGVTGDLWADKILGQADGNFPNSGFGETSPNEATSKNLFIADNVYVDQNNNTLYVWDSGNNRILVVHKADQAALGQGADMVLGQPDFLHTACNGDSNWQVYNWHLGVNSPPVLPNASCLCARSYESQSPGETWGVANMSSDSSGNLYVPDYYNNRVLRFDYPVYTGEAASSVWGQPSFFNSAYNDNGNNVSGGPTSTNLSF